MPVTWVLTLATALFCIGIYGVLARRNAVIVLMSIEVMLNAVNLNFVAFNNIVGEPSRRPGLRSVRDNHRGGRAGSGPRDSPSRLPEPLHGLPG